MLITSHGLPGVLWGLSLFFGCVWNERHVEQLFIVSSVSLSMFIQHTESMTSSLVFLWPCGYHVVVLVFWAILPPIWWFFGLSLQFNQLLPVHPWMYRMVVCLVSHHSSLVAIPLLYMFISPVSVHHLIWLFVCLLFLCNLVCQLSCW